jgi:DNA polymerase-4
LHFYVLTAFLADEIKSIKFAASFAMLYGYTVLSLTMRKIIHVDMDCFFAAVEMRDNPALRDIPSQ